MRFQGECRERKMGQARAGKKVFGAEAQIAGIELASKMHIEGRPENRFLKFQKD